MHRPRARCCWTRGTPSCSPRRRRGRAARAVRASSRTSSTWPSPTPTRRPRQAAGQFWIDFINETAPEFAKPTIDQLGDVRAADVPGADRRRPVLRAAAARDHRPPSARRDRRGQRRVVPGADDVGRRLRPDRLVQPAGDPWRRRRTGLLRVRRRRPVGVGRLPGGVRPHSRRDLDGVRRVVPRARDATAAETRLHAHLAHTRTSTSTRASSTTPTPGRSTRPGTGSTPASARPTSSTPFRRSSRHSGPRTAGSSTSPWDHSVVPTSASCSG